jgi:hypothetical protein
MCCRVSIKRRSFLAITCHRTTLPIIVAMAAAWFVSTASADTSTASRLIKESGQARSEGDLRLAYALLHDALRIEPDNAQAHWQLGEVKVGKDWVSIEETQRRAAADPRQARYQDRKDAAADTPADALALARWCRSNDLNEEARTHWARVLSADPTNREALRAIQMRWRDGQLLSAGDAKAAQQQASDAKRSLRQWSANVAHWMRALSDKRETPPDSILAEIRAVKDVGAIQAVEQATLIAEKSSAAKGPAPQRLSLAFIDALRDMPEEAATYSLLRYAVRSPFADVRSAATRELSYRPLTDVVPTLLDGLVAPIQSNYRVEVDGAGSVHYERSLYREGPFADSAHRTTRSIYQPWSPPSVARDLNEPESPATTVTNAVDSPVRTVSATGANRAVQQYEEEFATGEREVKALNEQTTEANKRIVSVLSGVTGLSLGDEPRAWWNWWQDYTDYHRSEQRPIYETRERSREYVRPPQMGCECFVRGTLIWTKTGQRPIESLSVGDLVLAQNVNSGELAFKPVMLRTLRPAGPTIQLTCGGETIRSTRGHPYWIEGTGWRMAKELEDSMLLHSVTGDARIESIQPSTEAETYNLVVADFNTYFVGKSGMLVHDNTPRRPTRCVVPGLIAE